MTLEELKAEANELSVEDLRDLLRVLWEGGMI